MEQARPKKLLKLKNTGETKHSNKASNKNTDQNREQTKTQNLVHAMLQET